MYVIQFQTKNTYKGTNSFALFIFKIFIFHNLEMFKYLLPT